MGFTYMGNTTSYDRKKYDSVNQDDEELVSFGENDKPTVIKINGTKEWRNKNGEYHRDGDEPAVILADGSRYWYKDGKYHRDGDEPAVILADGSRYWYKDGKWHRDGDEPAVILADGTKEWWKNGE
jgi:hypothetical protein